ncbi:MAG TPA: phosphomevalonate kinase, partial [Lactococcus sp.]|nr:phosphomevalonate kinase [Lactococcus sp.]
GEKLKQKWPKEFFEKSDELVIEISTAIDMQDFALFKEKLLENQILLINNQTKGYMTDQLALALNIINSQPELAGKISGAGFGENIILFAEHEENIAELGAVLEAEGMKLEKARIGKINE